MAANVNIWGTNKEDIDPKEYCIECEHSVGSHYNNCPLNPMKTAPSSIRKREYFRAGNLSGGFVYPLTMRPPIYVVKSYAQPIAVFDGDTWHVLDSDFISVTTSRHLNLVKRTIGTADAYSEYPVVPTLASMDSLIERLTK